MTKGRYSLLTNSKIGAVRVATSVSQSHTCPRITRAKLVCVLACVFIAALLLTFKCLGSRFSQLCCAAGGYSQQHGVHVTGDVSQGANMATDMSKFASNSPEGGGSKSTIHDIDKNEALNLHNKNRMPDMYRINRNEDINQSDKSRGQQRRRYPPVIIIGVRKGGTRALLEFLNLHPQIVAEKAEMHFFDDNIIYKNGLEWYRRKMPYTYPDQITIEKTPAYFTEESVPERVYVMNRTCKFLIVIRDPTERAISDYTQIYFNKRDKGKDVQSFEELAVDIYGTVNKSYKAIRRSMYYRHMERWLNFFPLRQFHVVDGAKLVSDPVPELRKVEEFMGLEHRLTKDRFYFNMTRGFYCMKLEHKEKCLAKSKGRTHPDVDPNVVKILHKFFKPLNQKFYSLVQRDFDWPTE